MGGLIFVLLLAVLIAVLVTPALRARFGRPPPAAPPSDGQESPHEVVVRRLDDHRARKSTPRDDPHDS